MVTVADLPVAVIAFGQQGCGHCHDFEPRFRAIAAKYERCVPSFFIDCDQDKTTFQVAQQLGIQSTPTTMIVREGVIHGRKLHGVLTDEAIERIFQRAMRGLSCEL